MMQRTFLISGFVLLTSGVLLSGCGTGSVVSNRYDNFTAYYNGFYNAERVFEAGISSVTTRRPDIDRTTFYPLFDRPTGATGSRDFESAIKKSADLLRQHPDSKWVDNALLLIGQSYFYQENFVGALQKFQEVISLDTDLRHEATFWLARTMLLSGAFEEAQTLLAAALLEDADRDWTSMYHLAMGELHVRQGQWENAALSLESGLERVRDKEVGARAQFLFGQVLEQLGRFEDAVRAFERVERFRPNYELQYAASYSALRVAGEHVDTKRALDGLRKMERDDKNAEKIPEIRYLRGRTLQYAGLDDEAFAIYDDLLYNVSTGLNTVGVRSRIHFALGEMYRDVDRNYVLASAHFDSAATAAGSSAAGAVARTNVNAGRTTGRQAAPEALEEIDDLRAAFRSYATVYLDIQRMDSLLWLGTLPAEEYEQKILELRRQRAEELAEQQRLLSERQRERQFQQQTGSTEAFGNQGLPPGKVVPGVNDGTTSNTAGFLYHEDPIRVQEGRATFTLKWGNRPLVPNWRRDEAVSGSSQSAGSTVDLSEDELEQLAGGQLPEIDTSGIPRDSTTQADMMAKRALARYELGNTLFLNMNMPDSAAVWYRKVIDEDADRSVAQRALYALAEVQRSLGDDRAADAIYRQIVDNHPDSDFAAQVRGRLGMEAQAVASDSSDQALLAYSRVFDDWGAVPDSTLLGGFLEVAAAWSREEAAAKAMLAAARVHLEMSEADSTRIVGSIQAAVSDETLMALWPDLLKPVLVDSVLTVPDPVVVDSVLTVPDPVVVDSVLVVPDPVPVDSVLAVPDPVPVDSVLAVPAKPAVHLMDLYDWVKDRFQGTDYYVEADRRAKALSEFTRPPVEDKRTPGVLTAADSLALAAMRGELRNVPKPNVPLAADSLQRADSASLAVRDSTLSTEQSSRVEALLPDGTTAPVDAGFYLRVGPRLSDIDSAAFMRQSVEEALMEDSGMVYTLVDLEPEDPEYAISIGPFEDLESAVAFLAVYRSSLDEEIVVLEVVDVP